ncbi:probable histidine kinase 2 [Panicum hallii]|uniref:probable histidine kinase 2 n=1 Tax=Panicum hallii TaxID=206008 RepID=UPI000DF4ECC9|nr:probable histidine kinase 2 [Panicum hallii]
MATVGKAIVTGVALIALMVFYVSTWDVTHAVNKTEAGFMGVAFRHVAGGMEPLLEANRAAVAIAGAAQEDPTTSNGSAPDSISQVIRTKMFMALAMQPQLAQVSYAGADGGAFAYYRDEGGKVRALFTDSHNRWKWNTQPVDPATGGLVGTAAAAAAASGGLYLPKAAWSLLSSKNASRASLGAGWARPGVRMLFFSAPAGDAGVVSAAVAVDDLLGAAASRVAHLDDYLDVYYAVSDTRGAPATAAYKPLLLGHRPGRSGDDEEGRMRTFSKARCAAAAIDAPRLGRLVAAGHGLYNKYRVACANFDVSGVQLVFRLVLLSRPEGDMLRALSIPVVVFAGAALAVAAASCVLAVRTLRRTAAREAALNADLVRQKEALRQAERKSMNKSNAFVSASHDIRSALSAIAGLVEMTRPEAQALPGIMENLDQMAVCTNKLFDILNSILDTSKVESGKMQLQEAEFSMADVLQESVDMANVTGIRQGLEVVWDPCDLSVLRCAAVTGDCKRLKQILDNLLGNALKFTDEGHVVLRAWANRPIAGSSVSAPSRFKWPMRGGSFGCLFRPREDPDDQDHVQNDPNLVEFYFEVADTGIGIPKEKRLSVFENYVQVNDGQGGTGLGLGIVQSFVRLMGGEISIKDKEPGERGTCFAFNVLLKMSERQEPQDIEEGTSAPSDPLNCSNFRASVFQEDRSFKGVHCVLHVRGGETMRILQTWMESVGVKVWPVLHAEFIASTLVEVLHNGATPAARASPPPTTDEWDDRCFSSKEMVSQVLPALRNSTGPRRGSIGGHPSGILLVIDVSRGRAKDICLEMEKLIRIKHQAPCKTVLLDDIRTPSDDLRRFKELMRCDLVLRKPVHGSRLFTLLMTLRDLQVSDVAQAQSSQVGPEIAGTSHQQQDLPEVVVHCAQEAAASAESEAAYLAQEQKPQNDKPMAGMQVLLAEDTLVLQTIQKKMLSQLGATVRVAQDGAVAVNLFKEALEQASVPEQGAVPLPYHVIFMDCQMPNIDGYEATKLIREEEHRYGIHTPIIALTAHNMEEDLQKAIDAGMDLHLTKPIERKRIVEAVCRVCKREN